MISVHELTKDYGPTRAVDCATFSVAPGETVGFLGPNGAGKTTTMRLMTGLFPPSSGDVTVDGYSVLTHPLEVKRRIGYLPESSPVYLDMTVEAYLRFVAEAKDVARAERRGQIEKVVADCGLADVRRKTARTLSKGYRQRLGLAQALIGDPPVIILDEPTAGLDPTQTAEFRRLIMGLKGERTVILSSHILPEVSMVCDRVVIISRGRILAQDSPENLARKLAAATEFLIDVEGPEEEVLGEMRPLEGVDGVDVERRPAHGTVRYRVYAAEDADPREDIVRLLVRRNWKLLELQAVRAGLEEVFLNLVTREEGVS